MGKKYKKKKYYNSNDYYSKKQQEDAFWTVVLIVAFFILLWIAFWLGVIFATILILKWTHKLNNWLNLYNTKYYYGAVITFLISGLIILFGGTQIAYNMGKINNTFWGWAVESSDYLKFNHSRGKTTIEPNVEGIIQKGVINSLTQTGTTK